MFGFLHPLSIKFASTSMLLCQEQTVWNQIRTGVLSVLIFAEVAASRERVKLKSNIQNKRRRPQTPYFPPFHAIFTNIFFINIFRCITIY